MSFNFCSNISHVISFSSCTVGIYRLVTNQKSRVSKFSSLRKSTKRTSWDGARGHSYCCDFVSLLLKIILGDYLTEWKVLKIWKRPMSWLAESHSWTNPGSLMHYVIILHILLGSQNVTIVFSDYTNIECFRHLNFLFLLGQFPVNL